MDEDDPTKVPSPDDIFGDFAAQGVESRVPLPAEWSAGMLPANDPYANATDLAREYGIRAQSKRAPQIADGLAHEPVF